MHARRTERQIHSRRTRLFRLATPMCCAGLVALVGCSSESDLTRSSDASKLSTSSTSAETTSANGAGPSSGPPATPDATATTSNAAGTSSTDMSAAETTTSVAATAAPPPQTDSSTVISVPATSTPSNDQSDIRLPAGSIVSMSWPTADDGWALVDDPDGRRTLLHTTDGATWAATAVESTGGTQVAFADETNGWFVGEGLSSTHDGGATWNAVSLQGSDTAISVAAVAAAQGSVHVAYMDSDAGGPSGLTVASSPVGRDQFVPTALNIQPGAGPRLDVSMSAGGPYGALIYNDRVFIGAAQIGGDGRWGNWNLACPYENPTALVGLSPQGKNLAVACAPSGFGDNDSIVGLNLTAGGTSWVDIVPAGDADTAMASLRFVTATDSGVRIVGYATVDGTGELAASTDGGATWTQRTPLPAGSMLGAFAFLPDGSIIVAVGPSGGLISADGISWSSVPAAG